ncbi:MAG: hypothetical protein E7012_01940 [Alphaproteobacteria bacterium]|nr:hypothetical protein [Alphaproteobacteria bacterium]
MQRTIKYLRCCFFLVFAMTFATPDASAFFLKFDIAKTASKITGTIQNIKSKTEEILEEIQNSQFGKFVGKGVEFAKNAVKFVKGLKDEIIKLYNKVKEKFEASPYAQSVIISGKIAKLEAQKVSIDKKKEKEEKEINDQIELLKAEADGKIVALKNNADVLLTKGDTVNAEKANAQIVEIEQQLEQDVAEQNNLLDELDGKYEPEINDINAQINELSILLAQLVITQIPVSDGKTADQLIKENLEKLATSDAVVSIKEEIAIKTARIQQMQSAVTSSVAQIASIRDKSEIMKEDIESNADLADTAPGESEASNALGETLSRQLDIMKDMISIMIADMKVQTAMEVRNYKGLAVNEIKGNFSLCNYVTEIEETKKDSSSESSSSTASEDNNGGDNNGDAGTNNNEDSDDGGSYDDWGGMF